MNFTEEFVERARWFTIYAVGYGFPRELLQQRFRLNQAEATELTRLIKGNSTGGADARAS